MKKLIVIVALLVLISGKSFAADFTIMPQLLNFQSLEDDGKRLAALGEEGFVLLSEDDGDTWRQLRPFERGLVLKIVFEDDRIVAFNNFGDISFSYDKAKTWKVKNQFQDQICEVIKTPSGYFVRGKKNIFALNTSLEETNSISFNSDYLFGSSTIKFFGANVIRSMTFYKGSLIAAMDSSEYARLTPELVPVDTFSLLKANFYDDKTKYYDNSAIFSTGGALNLEIQTIASRKTYGRLKILVRMEEFGIIKDTVEMNMNVATKVYGDSIYTLSEYDERLDAYFGQWWWSQVQLSYNDFAYRNGKIVVVGNNSLIRTVDLNAKYAVEISGGYWPIVNMAPIVANDNSLLLFNYNSRGTSLFMNRKQADRFEIKPCINMGESYFSDFLFVPMRYKYYDRENNKFYVVAHEDGTYYTYLYTSDDCGATYTESKIKSVSFPYSVNAYFKNASLEPELTKLGDNFILPMKLDNYLKLSSSIYVLNKDFKTDRKIVVPNTAIDYCYSLSPTTHFIHCANALDSASEIRYTTDGGEIWTTIAKYDTNYTELFVKEVKSKGRTYILVAHRNETDMSEIIDLIDIESRYKLKFEEWSKKNDPNFNFSAINFTSDDDFVYITRGDKLYAYPDLLDKSGMRSRTFPNNGRVIGVFMKYGSSFIATYKDDYYSRPNLCIIDPVIPLSAEEAVNRSESDGDIICGLPQPNPASKTAQFKVSGMFAAFLINSDITVYNEFGKAAGAGTINLDKLPNGEAMISWDCSQFEPGVYYISICRGESNKIIKAVVNR